ncbi:MAG: hypothetical protein NDI61_08700 [Bdellovibrionaceae bacterium]|nr:hypothetical protein [Pseudobdellovibrionaceae bacterium]
MMRVLNQRGAVGIALAALLPLLLASVALGAAVNLMLRSHAGALHECRTSLLQTENARLERLHELVRLNPAARRLRRQRAKTAAARKAARASGIPHVVAAAEAAHVLVLAQQTALRAKQLSLLRQAHSETGFALARLSVRLREQIRRDAHLAGADTIPRVPRPSVEWNSLAVRPEPVTDPIPDYFPVANFEHRQTIRVRWRTQPAQHLPDWLGFESLRRQTLHAQCASTAERKGKNTWRARLQMDKPLLNSYSGLSSL